jgi:hypothetical protein
LWQSGAGRRRLRLLIVAPVPYRRARTGRLYYRRPAFLLTTLLARGATPADENGRLPRLVQ